MPHSDPRRGLFSNGAAESADASRDQMSTDGYGGDAGAVRMGQW